MTKNKKILILTGSFGNGHLSVTNSIVNQFNQMNTQLTIIQHDLFLEAHPVITTALKKWYINSYKYFRNMYKMFYYSNPDQIDKCFYKYYGLNKLINILIKEKPDLILLTFPTPVVSLLTQEFNLNIPIATVITDYNMHKNWITPKTTRYYVAAEHTKDQLKTIGVHDDNVIVTGIPVHPRFQETPDRKAWLNKHNLNPDKKTLLMVAGAFGVVEGFEAMLDTINQRIDIQFVVVCGNNNHLIKQLKQQFAQHPNVLILGYTNEMSEWMAACDLMLTKPGGITITESLKRTIPLVFFNPAPGQEGENAIFFSNQGYARITHTIAETEHIIVDLFTHPEELVRLKTNMAGIPQVNAAKVICEDVIHLVNESYLNENIRSKAALYAKLFAK